MNFAFTSPMLLLALLALPVVYVIIRLLPPKPKKQVFPAIKLLYDLPESSPPPRTPPWWLLLLRLGAAALLIFALAGPHLRLDAMQFKDGPVVLVVDNDWRAANRFEDIRKQANLFIDQAGSLNKDIILLPTASHQEPQLLSAPDAKTFLQSLTPQPWVQNPSEAIERLQASELGQQTESVQNLIWLSSGLMKTEDTRPFLEKLGQIGMPRIILPSATQNMLMISQAEAISGGYEVTLWRPRTGAQTPYSLTLSGIDGSFITRSAGQFDADEQTTTLTLDVASRNNQNAQKGGGVLTLDGQEHLGAWYGLGELTGLPKVAISGEKAQDYPLLEGNYYLHNALPEYADPQFIGQNTPPESVNVFISTQTPNNTNDLLRWIETGGVYITFAQEETQLENMASLLPVRLRSSPRSLAGSLSWTGALTLGDTPAQSPLAGLDMSQADVQVTKQLLPQDSPDLDNKIWLSLEDGTPLITGDKYGQGWRIFVHVGADAQWSSLPLSGLFPQLIEKFINLARTQANQQQAAYPLPPLRLVNAYGQNRGQSLQAQNIKNADATISQQNPVGFYGVPRSPYPHQLSSQERQQQLLLPDDLMGLPVYYYDRAGSQLPFQKPLLIILCMLLLADGLFRVWGWQLFESLRHPKESLAKLRQDSGKQPKRRPLSKIRTFGKKASLGFLVLAASLSWAQISYSQTLVGNQNTATPLAGYELQIGYIPSFDEQQNALTRTGIEKLNTVLKMRSTLSPLEPKALNPEVDTLGYYPVIVWPIGPDVRYITQAAASNLQAYIQQGGLLILDGRTNQGENPQAMQDLLNSILKVTLAPMDKDHVLNRAFYLLNNNFGGENAGATLWRDKQGRLASVLVGNHNWVGSWAAGTPMSFSDSAGAEQAYRFGLNAIMYALLGDYKADQLHIETLLKQMREGN